MSVSPGDRVGPRLGDLADRLTHFISEVRLERIEIPPEAALRERLRNELERFSHAALEAGHPRPQVESAQYALAAGIDEALRFSRWPGKHGWSVNPLVVEMFDDRTAGVNFFERLAREEKAASPSLEVYQIVMALGFKGRFHATPVEVDRLLARVASRLGAAEGRELSPTGVPAGVATAPKGERSPALIAGIVVGAAVLLNVIYAVILGVLESGALGHLAGGS